MLIQFMFQDALKNRTVHNHIDMKQYLMPISMRDGEIVEEITEDIAGEIIEEKALPERSLMFVHLAI